MSRWMRRCQDLFGLAWDFAALWTSMSAAISSKTVACTAQSIANHHHRGPPWWTWSLSFEFIFFVFSSSFCCRDFFKTYVAMLSNHIFSQFGCDRKQKCFIRSSVIRLTKCKSCCSLMWIENHELKRIVRAVGAHSIGESSCFCYFLPIENKTNRSYPGIETILSFCAHQINSWLSPSIYIYIYIYIYIRRPTAAVTAIVFIYIYIYISLAVTAAVRDHIYKYIYILITYVRR